MSEKDELAKLAKRKKQIENKYARLAKKRLNYLNKEIAPKINFIDMSDDEFKKAVNSLKIIVAENNQRVIAQQQQRNQQRNFNNQ